MKSLPPIVRRTALRVCGGASLLLAFALASSPAHARRQGAPFATCEGCHRTVGQPAVSLELQPEQPEPGDTVQVRVRLQASGSQVGGFSLTANGDGTLSTSGDDVTIGSVFATHRLPKAPAQDEVVFELTWQLPAAPGSSWLYLAAVIADGDNTTRGDAVGYATTQVIYGCEPQTYYRDDDRDGFGDSASGTILDCEAPPGYAAVDGDCDPFRSSIYPGAPEVCNGRDDDCDGEIDEDAEPVLYYPDVDGDGFGDPLGEPIESCEPPPGYADNALDCDDRDPSANPLAIEVCDYVDNDCDGLVDEGVREICGVGLCMREAPSCSGGCVPGLPLEERCNNVDDDCDGEIDEAPACPAGQRCVDFTCVDADSLPPDPVANPSSSAAPSSPPAQPSSVSHSPVTSPPPNASPISSAPGSETPPSSSNGSPATTLEPQPLTPLPARPTAGGGCRASRGETTSPLAVVSWLSLLVAAALRRRRSD